jgi:hypothetical protein
MDSLPTNNSNEDEAQLHALDLRVLYRVYGDEQSAAHAAQLLVESGFPPRDVYVGVERDGRVTRAYTGWNVRLGIAASLGVAVSCTIGMLLVTSAAVGLISLPLGPLTGLSAISASTLSFIPSAIPGALAGWLVAALLWRRGAPNFPAQQSSKRAFVGVEVGPGNVFTAEHSMLHSHSTFLAREGDWPKLASGALQSAAA